jgi:hypothetical protein
MSRSGRRLILGGTTFTESGEIKAAIYVMDLFDSTRIDLLYLDSSDKRACDRINSIIELTGFNKDLYLVATDHYVFLIRVSVGSGNRIQSEVLDIVTNYQGTSISHIIVEPQNLLMFDYAQGQMLDFKIDPPLPLDTKRGFTNTSLPKGILNALFKTLNANDHVESSLFVYSRQAAEQLVLRTGLPEPSQKERGDTALRSRPGQPAC